MKNSFAIGKSTAGEFLKRAGDVAVNFRVTEKILSEIERRLFSPSESQFDIECVKLNLQRLKSLPPETDSSNFLQTEFALNQEFNLWRAFLEERDKKIETYHLRRFFDTADTAFDAAVFVALAYFYRNSEYFLSHLSKFDLVVTRLFSVGKPNFREPKLSRRERTRKLAAMFAGWDGADGPIAEPNPSSNETITARFDEFIFEAETLVDFEDLIQSNIFERLRIYKRELGRTFFEPEVIAVAVEANLVLGNIFNELLARANQNLGEKLNASFDFAGAFHDTSHKTQEHVSQFLKQLRSESLSDPGEEDLRHLWEILERVCGTSQPAADSDRESNVGTGSAAETLQHLVMTLQEPEPDIRMLREYTQKSKSLWTIDLNDFIRTDEPELDRFCRDILRLILFTDEICTHRLTQPKDVTPATLSELSEAFQESIQLGKVLEDLMERHTGSLHNRLLVVSNKFLESRLRLERTIVRFSHNHLPQQKTEPEDPIAETPVITGAEYGGNGVSRWLMALTVVIALACGGLYFVADQFETETIKSADFEELNIAELPASEHLLNAYRHQSTIFVITKQSWNGMTDQEKTVALQGLTDVPSPRKIDTVIATNAEGRPMGDLSSNGINVDPEL